MTKQSEPQLTELQAENAQLHRWHAEDRDALTAMRATVVRLRRERDDFRDQRNGVFATNEQLLAQVEESGLARIRAENEARTAKRAAAAPSSAYRRLLARLEADRAGHLRATVRAKEAGADEVLVAVGGASAAASRHAAAMAVRAFEGPDAAQAYMQRTEGGEEVVAVDADLCDRIARVVRTVPIRLGPNALAMVQRGESIILNMSEADAFAEALVPVLPEPRGPFDAQAGLQRLADSPAPGESYRHYKGGLYAVLAVAEDTGTGAPVVVYRDEQQHHWARPLAEFAGTVADGARRFTLEGEPAALPTLADRATLTPMFEGLARLLATSSRDWGTYRVDAWLYAVLVGWDCEQTEHDETCVHGAMGETAQQHGWDADTVAKARRYRAAVRRRADEAQQAEPWGALDARPGTTDCTLQQRHKQAAEGQPAEIVHGCPPDGSGLTPCCGRTPFELPLTDRISSEAPTTCTGADETRQADTAGEA